MSTHWLSARSPPTMAQEKRKGWPSKQRFKFAAAGQNKSCICNDTLTLHGAMHGPTSQITNHNDYGMYTYRSTCTYICIYIYTKKGVCVSYAYMCIFCNIQPELSEKH